MLLYAIIGHLVGDFILQNDWQALNKKKSTFICSVHCFLWTTCVCLFAGWPYSPWICLFLYLTHFIQDRTQIINWWMKLVGQEKFMTGPCSPWSLIVVDQVWHIMALYAVDQWIKGSTP